MTSPSTSPVTDPSTANAAAAPRRHVEVRETIAQYAKWLPEQRPLGVFVHLNPIGVVENHHFHVANEAAARIRGARTTQTGARYRELTEQRHIRPDDVAAAKERIAAMRAERIDDVPPPAPGTVLLSRVRPEMANEISDMVDSFLLRVLPPFLDLGSALWPMPGREEGFVGVMRRLARAPLGVPEPWLRGFSANLGSPSTSSIARIVSCLEERGSPGPGWSSVIHEALFGLPGYAGMIHRLEHHPEERPANVKISLEDYLAVRLVVEEHALVDVARRHFGRRANVSTLAAHMRTHPPVPQTPLWSEELAAFQDAFEEDYVRSFIGALTTAREVALPKRPSFRAQFVCCIDDRLESIRRHIEEISPDVETVGCAGFFGVALKHRAPLSVDETPSCPAPVTPVKRASEALSKAETDQLESARGRRRAWEATGGDDASRSVLGGALASFTSYARTPRMMFEMLFPQLFVRKATDFQGTKLVYQHDDDAEGFTIAEQTDLVFRNLTNIGLVKNFGRWVLIVGHGSMAVNNAFASGYQCGACGGQRGGFNARIFCAFANDPAVRAGLVGKGMPIPDDTLFVPGEHDTALDEIRWLEEESIPADRRADFVQLTGELGEALVRNTKERARRFEDVSLDASLEETRAQVQRRCADFAETRPEYNHATNAACVIGRRSLTQGLFLDRRSFLVSYDPTTDDEASSTLERLMGAPLPVCAGISLEYFYSTMDPQRWGCGTKLPHNVQGLLGVSNGADGDLRPGLWKQTTEIHEPIRLVTVIDAEPEDVTRVLGRLPAVQALADNAWIHLFALSPSDRGFFRWEGKRFVPYTARPHALYEVPSSLAACGHTRDHVAPCLIVPGVRERLSEPEELL